MILLRTSLWSALLDLSYCMKDYVIQIYTALELERNPPNEGAAATIRRAALLQSPAPSYKMHTP